MRPRAWALCLLVAWALSGMSTAVWAAAEEAVLELWDKHMKTPDDHEAIVKACQEFAIARPADPLTPVVRGIREWHLLRSGRQAEAVQLLEADLAAQPDLVADGASRLAKGWLTRIDRSLVAAALQAYYRKNVAYPNSLGQLPADHRPPATDRFGKPWSYKLVGITKVPGFEDQRYSLQSPVLGDRSDFKAALEAPYAARITAVPQQVVALPGDKQAARFDVAGKSVLVGLGLASGDLYFAFLGSKIVVLCDDTHWKILPRP